MSRGDDAAADEHGAALPQEAVGDPPAGERGEIDESRVPAVDRSGRLDAERGATLRHGRREVQDEQGAHAVVAEALPHLGEEERG